MIDAGVGLFIIVALSMLLLRTYQRVPVEQLPAGAVAGADLIAPEDLQITDLEETKRLRDQASLSAVPVFDFHIKAARDATAVVEELFASGRQSGTGATPDQLQAYIEERLGLLLETDQIEALMKHNFNDELEHLMIDQLESVMMTPVVASRSQFRRLGASAIVRREPKSGQEFMVTDLSSIRDKLTAAAALRSEKLIWPADYDPRDRKLLGEVLGALIVPNLDYNEVETEARRVAARDAISPVTVNAEKGKPIVARGEIVTPAKALLLAEASRHRPIRQRAIEFAGTVVIVMVMVLILWQYLVRYQRQHLRLRRHFLLQMAGLVVTVGVARIFFWLGATISHSSAISPFNSPDGYRYLAPLALGAVLVTLLTDSNAAFVFSAVLSVFVGVLSGDVYLAAYTLISSAGAIYHLQDCRDRTALVAAGLWIGGLNGAAVLALDLLGASEPHIPLLLFDSLCGFVSGVLATMVASILLPLFEWLFKITTSIKLLELSNLNLPLLKQLAELAPGTYHHSIMVGLLAEAGAEAIGADALFARVACYYHDIGKSVRPTYFVENQSYMENRHDKLSPKMSAIVLSNHVKQGIEIARQHKLPPRIVAIIPQHHGTGLMKFFYYKARTANDDADSTALEQEFRYPGPKPQSKEAAIIMIADSVEAAARTVQDPTPGKLRNMIDMITNRIRDDGQFDECDITLRELRIVAESFTKVLIGIHHHRISYPGFDFNRAAAGGVEHVARPEAELPEARPVAAAVKSRGN